MTIITVMALLWLYFSSFAAAAQTTSPFYPESEDGEDDLIVSILTCYPGPEIYELCGHSALRIRNRENDIVWNYGVFDFNEPNFVYRFVKGESDYMLVGAFFNDFLEMYKQRGSKVVEQQLNLTPAEKERLASMIYIESLPENRTYRYNYVLDNCATRILDRIEESADASVIYPDTLYFPSFRREMMNYHKNYPWYQFGIDMALGENLDLPLTGRQDMFAPLVMRDKLENTKLSDGRKLVKSENVIFDGSEDAVLPPTPLWKTPQFLFWLIFGLATCVSIVQIKRIILVRWFYTLWFGLLTVTGCVITFLVFFSTHEATSPNLLIFWMNPLQIILAIGVWFRAIRKIGIVIAGYNIIILLWQSIALPLSERGAQGAFLPIMLTTLLLSVIYIYVEIRRGRETVKANRFK